jgi:glycerate dehydrogenase
MSDMKKIIVLDGYALNPLGVGVDSQEHPSWEALGRLGDLRVHDRTASGQVAERCAEAEIILTNKVAINAGIIGSLLKLEYIGVLATGTNIVDLNAATARGIPVTNVPGYSTMTVAQHVIGLMYELLGYIGTHARAVRAGAWERCPDFCFIQAPFHELSGKVFGLVGFGAIAQAVGRVAVALGMRVLVHSRTQKASDFEVEWCSLRELLQRADVVSLHCPLTEETRELINDERLGWMRPSALLINTGRGPLLSEDAVARALFEGRLAGFGADVLGVEPPRADNPLLQAPRTVITPHIAWASVEARKRLMAIVVENVAAFLHGKIQNKVNAS